MMPRTHLPARRFVSAGKLTWRWPGFSVCPPERRGILPRSGAGRSAGWSAPQRTPPIRIVRSGRHAVPGATLEVAQRTHDFAFWQICSDHVTTRTSD